MLYWPLFLYLYTLISGRAWHEFESKIVPLSFFFHSIIKILALMIGK